MTSLSTGQVRSLQTNMNERLRARGRQPIAVDGKYGPATRKAVHLLKYLLGFPMRSLDTGPSWWFRTIVAHPSLRPLAYLERSRSRAAFLKAHPGVTGTSSRKGSEGIDFAWGDPDLRAVRAAGKTFMAQYLSHDRAKNLTGAEAHEQAAAGLDCVVVWETTANRSAQGRLAGAADATEALRQARACGMPAGRPIYFAVDFDATLAQVRDYFEGVRSVIGREQAGVYGSANIVDTVIAAGLVKFGWQTYAWSRGRLSSRAHLYQYSNGHTLARVSCDYDRALADDFGQWRP